MKNAKKIIALLFSLVLLVGIFSLTAFADETATGATVVYPDGLTEAVAVGQAITPKPFTEGLYNGANNTLFKDDAAAGWIFTVEGEETALSDLTVTEAMAGKTIIASGADKVYYSAKTADGITYNTNAGTYANDLRNLLRNTPVAQTVCLYEDVTFAATYTWRSTTCTLNFDLNGHTWTITSSFNSYALDCSSNVYIYSSKPNGVIDVPDASYFFRTNNRKVTEINDTERTGYFHIGDNEAGSGYGRNLTVYCKQINSNLYSSEAHILGGTYIQRENSTTTYFLLLSRAGKPGQNHFKTIKNATFIVTKKGTAPLYWNHKALTFTNCNFINATDTYVPLMVDLQKMTEGGDSCGTPTFSGCNFFNVTPVKRDSFTYYSGSTGTWTAAYNSDCSFGFSGAMPSADMDNAADTALYLAHSATSKTITVNEKTYVLDGTLITDPSKALLVSFADEALGAEYWCAGAVVRLPEVQIEQLIVDGKLCKGLYYSYSDIAEIDSATGKVLVGGSVSIPYSYESAEKIYFTRTVGDVVTYYGGDEATVHADFISLLGGLGSTSSTIKFYSDFTLTLSSAKWIYLNGGTHYMDLNGHTFTLNSSVSTYAFVFNNGTMYIYSSAPGGVFDATKPTSVISADSSGASVWGENKNDGTVNYGANFTMKCRCLSTGLWGNGYSIAGGTYIIEKPSKSYVIDTTQSAKPRYIRNATFIIPGGTKMFNGSSITNGVQNCNFIFSSQTDLFMGTSGKNNTFKNCNFYNTSPMAVGTYTITYTDCRFNAITDFVQGDDRMAFTDPVSVTANGKTYVFNVMLAPAALVEWGMGAESEYWTVGTTATHDAVLVDGFFAYTFAPFTVVEGENKATATLSGVYPGTIQMSLTLQGQIGLNFMLREEVFAGTSVRIGEEAIDLGEAKNGYYKLSYAVAPNMADEKVILEITIGTNVHKVSVGVDAYAKTLIESESESIVMEAKRLTYAMVEYVRAMTKNEAFCSVSAPEGYSNMPLYAVPYEKNENNTLLSMIRFNLSNTIEIEIKGEAGKEVNIIFANGRNEQGIIGENGSVIFKDLYVNEFFGDITIKVEDEIYTYSLANYLAAMVDASEEAVILALYNYTYHANVYVMYLQGRDESELFDVRKLNAVERIQMRDGILALMFSENIDPIKLMKDMYLVAFSESPTLAATPKEVLDSIFSNATDATAEKMRAIVAPTLFGGSAVDASMDSLFLGSRSFAQKKDLIVGDLLFVTVGSQTNAYIYDGSSLISVMNGCSAVDTNAVLNSLENAARYAVLRPSITLATLRYSLPAKDLNLTDAQIALIETAKAYLQRGYRQQYDDTGMAPSSEYRWQIGQFAPEDYTSQKWGYLNCAAFTYECYRNALGMDLGSRYTTNALCKYYLNGGTAGAAEYPYYYHNGINVSQSDRIAEQEKFMSTLVPGDLVVILRDGGYGHVMLYIGNGVLIHSSGSSFAYSNDSETYEPTIRYMNVLGYLFNPDSTNYLFREVEDTKNGGMRPYIEDLAIVRPLDSFNGKIPENTQNRIENLIGILSEKLSSHPEGKTVNIGDAVTFTFRLKNNGLLSKTLEIKDYIPENATLLSAGDFTFADGVLSVSVTVKPGETIEVSYTVIASGELGAKIHGTNATVGGVLHTCPPTYIGNTLTEAQQAAILAAVEQFKASNPENLTNFALVNAIYKAAGLEAPFADGADVRASLFKNVTVSGNSLWQLSSDSEYYSMVVPTMYGGRKYYTPQKYTSTSKVNTDRSRLPREQALVVGDIVVVQFSSSPGMYMYVGGDHLINISNSAMPDDSGYTSAQRLMRMMSVGTYYTILRPSLG